MRESSGKTDSKLSYYYFRVVEILCRFLAGIYPLILFDEIYCSAKYRRMLHERLNLKNPQKFTEKIQWLKLYDRNPEYTPLQDKYAVREYVQNRIGEQYLNQLLGVYSSVDEIDIMKLPDKFVLKATHGCGWNILCNDKEKLNINDAKASLAKWLKMNWYHMKGEWGYKDIPPKIICEKYLEDENHQVPTDYKFYCFKGIPRIIMVVVDRFEKITKSFYNEKWILQPFTIDHPYKARDFPPPPQLNLMLELAGKLSSGINFCRVDLYNINGRVIFGEMTFYSQSGFHLFFPRDYDGVMGKFLDLPA